jgi:HlyD family secretion protein
MLWERRIPECEKDHMDRRIEKKKLPPKKIAWLTAGAAFLCLVVWGLISTGSGSTLRVDSRRITISEVSRGEFQEYISVNGTVLPISTFYLDAVEGGRVKRIFVEEGSYVSVGDDILELDNTDLHLDIMYREAQLFEQINNLRNTRLAMEQQSLGLRDQLLEIDYQVSKSKRQYEQYLSLIDKDHISRDAFDQAREDYDYWRAKRDLTVETQKQDSILRTVQIEQLERSVERMQTNLEVVKQKLEDLAIRAPIEGQLTLLNAEVGESKSRGERIGQIDVLEGFKIRAAVDEYYIARVAVGQGATVSLSDVTYYLEISKVYPEVRQGRFEIDLEFGDPGPEGIRRGQTVQLRLALGNLSEAVTVARGGFYQKTAGRWIYVVDESGEFAIKRRISLGMQNPQEYEVLEGLEPGERVITSSYDGFEDFDRLVFKDR